VDIKSREGIGIYYDSPSECDASDLRSLIGVTVDCPDEKHCEEMLSKLKESFEIVLALPELK
jgi:DNA gyrase inhibitor GyrI